MINPTKKERDKGREKQRQRETKTERDREREGERERERKEKGGRNRKSEREDRIEREREIMTTSRYKINKFNCNTPYYYKILKENKKIQSIKSSTNSYCSAEGGLYSAGFSE